MSAGQALGEKHMAIQMQQVPTGPHRWIICTRWKRNMLRMVPGGATVLCGSCREPHFYSREELNTIWDELEREQAQGQPTEIKQ